MYELKCFRLLKKGYLGVSEKKTFDFFENKILKQNIYNCFNKLDVQLFMYLIKSFICLPLS